MWQEENNALVKNFKFADFKSALEFVNKVGELADTSKLHPDIDLGWGRVTIRLTTHNEQTVTQKDRDLATEIDAISDGNG